MPPPAVTAEFPTAYGDLHPEQRAAACHPSYAGPALVTGGPGTGKTVVALHRARFLAEQSGSGRVLLTTCRPWLADALRQRLDGIIGDDEVRERIDVTDVDRFAADLVAEYEGAEPHGRTPEQLATEAAAILDAAPIRSYCRVVVDEAQELSPEAWQLLGAVAGDEPDNLFILADPQQRLSGHLVELVSLGVGERTRQLQTTHRTTQEILAWSVPILGTEPFSDLDSGPGAVAVESSRSDNASVCRAVRHGMRPKLHAYPSAAAELEGLVLRISTWLSDDIEPSSIAVAARTERLAEQADHALAASGVPVAPIVPNGTTPWASPETQGAVRVGTMADLKGLEFGHVALIGVAAEQVPLRSAVTPPDQDQATHASDVQRERNLLYVAATRAGTALYLSHAGAPSPFLPKR